MRNQKTLLAELPMARSRDDRDARALRAWAREERTAWLAAISLDPLLPEELLPRDYLGQDTWRVRAEVLREAAKQLRSFCRENGT
jgi:DNA-binding transcriptional regulator PaaX